MFLYIVKSDLEDMLDKLDNYKNRGIVKTSNYELYFYEDNTVICIDNKFKNKKIYNLNCYEDVSIVINMIEEF